MIDQKIIIRYLEGDLHPSEAKALIDWLRSSPEALKKFTDIKEQLLTKHENDQGIHKAWERIQYALKTGQLPELAIKKNRGRSRHWQLSIKVLSYAALFVAIIASTWYIVTKVQEKELYGDNVCLFIAPKGEKCQVVLPDSSLVKLNSGSVLKFYPVSFQKNRVVELDGEAYFNVRCNPDNPFTVTTAYYDVIATGTAFNVMTYSKINKSEVILVEGSVTVESNDEAIILNQGEKVVYSNNGFQKSDYNQTISLSWTRDEFIFSQIPFSELMFRLENWFNVEIIFDKTAFDYSYSGSFKNRETIEQILDAIKKYEDISYERKDNTIKIKSEDIL